VLHPYLCDERMSYENAADFLREECGFDLTGWEQLATLMLDWIRMSARAADDEIAAGPNR